jgi:hypothetical protein
MGVSRVLPVLVATAAVLVASTGSARPVDSAARNLPGAGVAAPPEEDLPPMMLLFATSDPQELAASRVEICDQGNGPVPGQTAYKIGVKPESTGMCAEQGPQQPGPGQRVHPTAWRVTRATGLHSTRSACRCGIDPHHCAREADIIFRTLCMRASSVSSTSLGQVHVALDRW